MVRLQVVHCVGMYDSRRLSRGESVISRVRCRFQKKAMSGEVYLLRTFHVSQVRTSRVALKAQSIGLLGMPGKLQVVVISN